MRAVDTNILVRFLVGDDEQQAQQIYALFRQAELENEQFMVPLLVVLELMWVLDAVYEVSRREIIDSLKDLLLMPILKFEAHPAVQECIAAAQAAGKPDLPDLLIAHSARRLGCEQILTFDKKAAKYKLFSLV